VTPITSKLYGSAGGDSHPGGMPDYDDEPDKHDEL
jgi:hypothetical protein